MEDGTLSILFGAIYPAIRTVHSQNRCLNKYHSEWILWDVAEFTQSIYPATNKCQHLCGITVENEWINLRFLTLDLVVSYGLFNLIFSAFQSHYISFS